MPAKIEDILADMQFASDRISGQVRVASVSLLAVTWGLLIGEPTALEPVTSRHESILLLVGGLAVVSLALDFFQYVAGYLVSRKLLGRLTAEGRAEGDYNYTSIGWRLRSYFFWGKQGSVAIAIVLFLYLVGAYLVAAHQTP